MRAARVKPALAEGHSTRTILPAERAADVWQRAVGALEVRATLARAVRLPQRSARRSSSSRSSSCAPSARRPTSSRRRCTPSSTRSTASSLTLRPEGTASCVRAAIEHSLPATSGRSACGTVRRPMYRVDAARTRRKGRYRQFYQYDVEALGYAGPDVDAEHDRDVRACGSELGHRRHPHRASTTQIRAALQSATCTATALVDAPAHATRSRRSRTRTAKRRLQDQPAAQRSTRKNPAMQEMIDGRAAA